MSKPIERVEIIIGIHRRRRYTGEEKVRLVEQTMQPGMTVSAVARLHGVSPSCCSSGGGAWPRVGRRRSGLTRTLSRQAAPANSRRKYANSNASSAARLWKPRYSAGPWNRHAQKTHVSLAVAATAQFPVKAVAETLGVARSNLIEQFRRFERPRRGPYRRAEDEALLAEIRSITDARPTYGYRRVTALLNRARHSSGEPQVNHKRIFRVMRLSSMLLQPYTGRRLIRAHEVLLEWRGCPHRRCHRHR